MLANAREHQHFGRDSARGPNGSLDAAAHFPAAHAWHHHVQDHHIHAVRLGELPSFVTVPGFHHLAAERSHTFGNERPQLRLVIRDKHLQLHEVRFAHELMRVRRDNVVKQSFGGTKPTV